VLPGREVDRPPQSSAEVKNEWSYSSTPPICFHGVDRDNFTLQCELASETSWLLLLLLMMMMVMMLIPVMEVVVGGGGGGGGDTFQNA
jgi:hypothetical protein